MSAEMIAPSSREANVRRYRPAAARPAATVGRQTGARVAGCAAGESLQQRTPVNNVAAAIDHADVKWDALLVCVAGYILTAVGRIHQLFGALEAIHLAAITGLLAVVLWLMDRRQERQSRTVPVATTRLAGLLLFWMIISVTSALRVGNSFDLVFDNFIKTALMSFVVAASVRTIRDVERLVLVYLVGAVVYAAVVLTRFDLGSGDAWRLGHLYYYDANDFATYAVSAMPLGIYFLHAGRRMVLRLFAAAGLVVLTLGFVWSGSRGGFIALAAVALFVVLRFSAIPLRWRLFAPALVAVVLLATASDQYWQQMGTIASDADYNQTAEAGRLQIWRRGIGYMMDNPVLGLGPGNFQTAEGTLSPLAERQQYGVGVRWNAPHNSFVQIGAELGFPGLALYIAVIASAFYALRRAGDLSPALTASLLGFVVGSFFLSLAYSEMLYTLVALAVGLRKVSAAHAAPA
jgi:putative inorganic carbon (HCO3(-)) transporter